MILTAAAATTTTTAAAAAAAASTAEIPVVLVVMISTLCSIVAMLVLIILFPFLGYSRQKCHCKKEVKPERIIIVRHGQSLGNIDERAYVHIPDWQIPLTEQGFTDARLTGQAIKKLIGDKPVLFYTSPYLRTKQTLAGIVKAFAKNKVVGVIEEPRLSELQFANYQDLDAIRHCKEERRRYGRFYYRFQSGESGLDVYNRATDFIATIYRDFTDHRAREDVNVIIVTHGLTLRLLVMRWFHLSINDFEESRNPGNGQFVVMERKTNGKRCWFELMPESLALVHFKPARKTRSTSISSNSSSTSTSSQSPYSHPSQVMNYQHTNTKTHSSQSQSQSQMQQSRKSRTLKDFLTDLPMEKQRVVVDFERMRRASLAKRQGSIGSANGSIVGGSNHGGDDDG